MFTQRNNKAKCFQDCIVEKKNKQNRKMNGLRFRWDSGSGDGELGLVLSWIRLRWGGWGGLVRKPQTFHLVLYPLVVKLNVECRGSVETDADLSRDLVTERTDGFEGIRLEGLKLALIQNLQIHLNFLPRDGIISTAGQFMADPEWSCKRWRNVYWTGRYSWEETKETRGQRVVYCQDDSSDLSC